MRLARAELDGRPRLGVVVGEDFRPLDPAISALARDDLAEAAARPEVLAALAALALGAQPPDAVPLAGLRLLPPVARPGKIVAIGRNYAEHAAEQGVPLPSAPLVFAKFTSSIIGPGEPITWDARITDAVDFEAELAVVIGRRAKDVTAEDALDHVLGYTCLNDVSARDVQFGDGQWVRGKSLDTFCPIGPWVVTAAELADVQRLAISCTVSGERLQAASTAEMAFGVAALIAYLSRSFVLEPGDVIATGTPPGCGYFREPRRMLRDGDEVVVEIEGIGALRNPVVVRA